MGGHKPGWIALIMSNVLLRCFLALFFGFVGYNKAFASLADLKQYGAWTIHIAEMAGRFVGWSEILCAAALLFTPWRSPRIIMLGAGTLIINQLIAGGVHASHGENAALPQNAVLITLLLFIIWSTGKIHAIFRARKGEEDA